MVDSVKMWRSEKQTQLFALSIFISILSVSLAVTVTDDVWNKYKEDFSKDYRNSPVPESYARFYFAYNKQLIENHNAYYRRGLRSFFLDVNQFTDMRLITFNALFPVTTQPPSIHNVSLPIVSGIPPDTFDPISDVGINLNVEDQGTACNSGWAYATAKSVELFNAYNMPQTPPKSLSGQSLIDCAGSSIGCKTQVPQTGFEYLTQYGQELFLSSEYLNRVNDSEQGMCTPPRQPTETITLANYARINNGDDETMRRLVPTNPVVIEFNPTSFEFMHYAGGIFQQPAPSRGSHFMTVIGYGTNATVNLNYFTVQNSFGNKWGENGLIRIAYSKSKPLAKSAILPVG